MRSLHNKPYKDLLDMGEVPFVRIKHGHPEYIDRIKTKRPLGPPPYQPGEFVYSFIHDANVPVVSVTWDAGHGRWGWRISTPGHGGFSDSFSRASSKAKTAIYSREGNGVSWRKIAEQPPVDGVNQEVDACLEYELRHTLQALVNRCKMNDRFPDLTKKAEQLLAKLDGK